MKLTRRAFAAGAVVCLALGLSLAPAGRAVADRLDDAKKAGWVGERIDGYLGVVDPDAPDDVKGMVERINAERRAKYERIAKRNNTTLTAVERLAGKKLIGRAEPGEYVMDSTGKWKRK